MKKEVRKFKVDFNFNWTYGVEIKKLKQDLEELEKLGVTEIEIEAVDDYGSASVTIEAFTNRIETDDEFNLRVNENKKRKQDLKKRELEQLEKLKLKYNQ